VYTFLNDYVQPIIDITSSHGGTVNAFMEDTVVAVFGDPGSRADDAVRAVRSAINIQQHVEDINITWRRAFDFLVEIDIGISTGEVLAGNVGHEKKMQYTVMGHHVSLARQLARLCRMYSVNILLDKTTYAQTKDDFNFRDLGERLILGFTEPVVLYTPIFPAA
jgi:adenylate cyclase